MSMWSSGNWSLQQAAYANIPANEVDWGSLAKQWITQRETILPETFNQPPPPPPPPPPESYGIDSSAAPAVPSDSAVTQPQPQQLHYGDPTLAPPGWGWGGWGGIPGWNMPPAPVPVVMPSTDNGSIEYSGYSGFGAGYDTASYDQYWNQSAASQPAGPFVATNDQAMNKFLYPGPLSRGESALISDDLGIDSAKRRQLPAWIREGLEKVEREKQKMLEKERRETEPQLIDSEAFNNYNKEDNSQATKDRAEIVEPETYPRRHSRFDTSDNEGSEHSDAERPSFVRRKTPSPEPMSEEEKQAQLMIRIRQMLTEVLLDVTNSELTSIANEVYSKERAKKAKGRSR